MRRATGDKRVFSPDAQSLLPLSKPKLHSRDSSHTIAKLTSRKIVNIIIRAASAALGFLILGQFAVMPAIKAVRAVQADLTGVQRMSIGIKITETLIAVISVSIVTVVYRLLIRRGTLMSTTAIYPCSAVEKNIGKLLSSAWPDYSGDVTRNAVAGTQTIDPGSSGGSVLVRDKDSERIRLMYIGKMRSDEDGRLIAKGLFDSCAEPKSRCSRARSWLTSGSPLMKTIVQLLIWQWATFWLVLLMVLATLIYNGFLTGELAIDSYPRLTIIVLYSLGYLAHSIYVWRVISDFLTNVGAGAAWSLLERANFVVCHHHDLRRHPTGRPFSFRGIDKASKEHVPTMYEAVFRHETASPKDAHDEPIVDDYRSDYASDDPQAVKAALATIEKAQEDERDAARDAAKLALDRVMSNVMIVTGIILSSGFSSWTSNQATENTPNNFNSQQIGSLALLTSLSLGAAAMFTSAMHLSVMESSFNTILSLKETKINGQAVDHYKKRSSTSSALSFTNHDSDVSSSTTGHAGNLTACRIGFMDILTMTKASDIAHVFFLGPAYTLLPDKQDHIRTSRNLQFDLFAEVRGNTVVLTTQPTNEHALTGEGTNVEAVNVCLLPQGAMKSTLAGSEDTHGKSNSHASEKPLVCDQV
ncbi:uncharacterized protein A1O5_13137 [Cladophialophora psammophila CBS 110553]|uniref:Uncharacterized protein n=1 Tax=Cladophialophora psammophila CBS 110553 TaxID=1182543 RepID=W9WNJ6_9EURO|nr:uncharacterized protein A1O5_10388 [Cladophialophora psammophila CBS 110553]XP_007751894.1 uncharacterized protein A1O5_13137 [Cladophialophora psammophila CBS 110553]EXJ53685.1 hypothetical protein A1O5_13137 [Cladophialophora psammophila CBS 110553]EXJ66236.1 hypothetical protein A1O5_10388 [Cladophialophora psammophila CBS 110553]